MHNALTAIDTVHFAISLRFHLGCTQLALVVLFTQAAACLIATHIMVTFLCNNCKSVNMSMDCMFCVPFLLCNWLKFTYL